jgi:hypothetical protein
MRGPGDFQRKQSKKISPLVPELFSSLRQVVDVLERLTTEALEAQAQTEGT